MTDYPIRIETIEILLSKQTRLIIKSIKFYTESAKNSSTIKKKGYDLITKNYLCILWVFLYFNKVGYWSVVSHNEITWVFKIVDIFRTISQFSRVQINTLINFLYGLLNLMEADDGGR